MLYSRKRRGTAAGLAAILMLITIVATVASGAIIFYSRGGTLAAIGLGSPSTSGTSVGTSGGLTSGLSNSTVSSFSSALAGISGLIFNSSATTENATLPIGGRVAVSGSSLPAADFTAAGTTATFTCSSSPSAAYLALTDTDTGSVSVTSISLASAGNDTMLTPSGPCSVSASQTTYIVFPATTLLAPSPLQGSYYAGVVGFSDETAVPFEGVWQ